MKELSKSASFDGLVTRKEIFSESSHRIDTHLDVVKEVLEIQRSVSFEFCLDGEPIMIRDAP